MARRQRRADETENVRLFSFSTLTDARGIRPVDYVLPSEKELERVVAARLASLLGAGALDAENLGALDELLLAEEERIHHLLDEQRASHQQACADLVSVARSGVVRAQRALEEARERRETSASAVAVSERRLDELGLRHTVDA